MNLSHTAAEAQTYAHHVGFCFEGEALTGTPRWRLRRHQRVTGEGQPPLSTLRLWRAFPFEFRGFPGWAADPDRTSKRQATRALRCSAPAVA
jgi:hypothetical protein